MADNLTLAKGLAQQTIGGNNDTWGIILNDTIARIDKALGGTLTKAITDNTILSDSETQNTGFHFTGTLSGPKTIIFPLYFGMAVIQNSTTQTLTCGLASGTTVSIPANQAMVVWSNGNNFVSLTSPTGPVGIPERGALSGLGLSNDGTLPNTVIDIAAGTCTDSTNTTTITLASFTKSIAGAWAAGTGANGMGPGVTATASTWYHVYAANVGGSPDVFLDSTFPPTHLPAGTTAHRRIRSIKLDASVHIIPDVQNGDRVDWVTPINEFTGITGTTSPVAQTLAGTPPGLQVEACLSGTVADATSINCILYLSSTAQADVVPAPTGNFTCMSGPTTTGAGPYAARIVTNTSAQIRRRVTSGTGTLNINTNGYIDTRGRG